MTYAYDCLRLVVFTSLTLMSKAVSFAARQVPIYKPVIDMLLMTQVDEWATMSSEKLFPTLESVSAKRTSSLSISIYPSNSAFDGVKANAVFHRPRERQGGKRELGKEENRPGICFDFQKGSCTRSDCRFQHTPTQSKSNASVPASTSKNETETKNATKTKKCDKCGGSHL